MAAEREAEEYEGQEMAWEKDRETPRRAQEEVVHVGGGACPQNVDHPYFTPERAHMLLRGVCGDFPHHKDRSHLDGGVMDNAV